MGVPSKDELDTALKFAQQMREHDLDPKFIAKCLLNFNYRMELMDKVLFAAKRYLRSGSSPKEHTALLRAVEAAERASRQSTDNMDRYE
ncbi:MAG: hypothetical protein V2I33_08800 [Kangiellaceae bacterium]|jgi:hypothetical protein|nr:hypothetical protein [Kangiellaceae bacterium]